MYKSKIQNPKSKINPLPVRQAGKSQIPNYKSVKYRVLSICLFFIFWNLAFGFCNFVLYAQDGKEEEALFVAKKACEDGFYEVSLGLLERFLKNYPDSKSASQAELLIGECYFYQNRFLDALSKFEELLESPEAAEIRDAVLYRIAEVYFKGNNYEKASFYYKKIIDEFPISSYAPYSYYSLGWAAFQENEFAQAVKYFQVLEKLYSGYDFSDEGRIKIIECLYNLGEYKQLKERAQGYLKLYSKDQAKSAYFYFYLAEANYYLDNFQQAAKCYTQVLSGSKDNQLKALSRLGLAWAQLKLKQYDKAGEYFREIDTQVLGEKSREFLILGEAILFFETNEFKKAADLYSGLINSTQNPLTLIQAYLGKADSIYNQGDAKRAIGIYKEALEKVTDDIPQEVVNKINFGLALAFLEERQFQQAVAEFQKVVNNSKDASVKVSALTHIADTYRDIAEYSKAIEVYSAILKQFPDNSYADYIQYQLGLAFLSNLEYDNAIKTLTGLRISFPESEFLDEAFFLTGSAYFQKEDYNSSTEVFKKFQQEFRESKLRSEALYLLGISLYNLGEFDRAIEVFKQIIRMRDFKEEVVQKAEYQIADSYYQMGREKEAAARFKVLRAKYPDSELSPEIMWWLGEYYYRRNDLDLAKRYFNSLIRDFPESNLAFEAYYVLGRSYLKKNDLDKAMENFKNALNSANPQVTTQASIALADIYLKQDKSDLALEIYNKRLAEDRDSAPLLYPKMAAVYQKTGNYQRALEYYRKCLKVLPTEEIAAIRFKIAEVLQEQGDFTAAVQEYKKAVSSQQQNNPFLVKALLRIAKIYEDQANFQEAVGIYNKIAAMDIEEAKFARERIDLIKAGIINF
ncbi:MAG: hypothetical protein DRP74_06955 [Candidatus Omnitrophota bacterium]|nr:MAG: hypothetical protein DRP74_06955 [Candidatus Omnitrophota bacterium]